MAIAPGTTLVDYIIPARTSRSGNLVKDGLLILGFSAFLGLCAQVSFHIPFTPVPVTLQTLAVLLTGAALGSKRGGLAMLLYLAEGAMGLPVFAGGASGFIPLVGFTAGYLWSYPIVAFVIGLLCERGFDRNYFTTAIAMLIGTAIIYAMGMSWLAVTLHLDLYKAFLAGMLPFIPGDLLKLVIAVALLPTAWHIINWAKPGSALKH